MEDGNFRVPGIEAGSVLSLMDFYSSKILTLALETMIATLRSGRSDCPKCKMTDPSLVICFPAPVKQQSLMPILFSWYFFISFRI